MTISSYQKIETAILKVIRYYHFFDFAPSFELIYTFFPNKISQKELQISLDQMVKQTIIIKIKHKGINIKLDYQNNLIDYRPTTDDYSLYTLPQYSISMNKQMNKLQMTNDKLRLIQPYLRIISKFPMIRMIGITGSASMGNCKKNDDIDLCIITKSKSLWFTRFICVALAKMMNLYGKQVCLNLFFDEIDLTVPTQKQTQYIGHELLQMKPIINKDNTYERMLSTNSWIFSLFPNAKNILSLRAHGNFTNQISSVNSRSNPTTHRTFSVNGIASSPAKRDPRNDINLLCAFIERFFKSIQLPLIRKNKTALLITSTQLWLFKKDFEEKITRIIS